MFMTSNCSVFLAWADIFREIEKREAFAGKKIVGTYVARLC
jgi:hypothetical protein